MRTLSEGAQTGIRDGHEYSDEKDVTYLTKGVSSVTQKDETYMIRYSEIVGSPSSPTGTLRPGNPLLKRSRSSFPSDDQEIVSPPS